MKIEEGKSTMPTMINLRNMNYRYDLAHLSEVDYKVFLNAGSVEQKMLAVVGTYKGHDPELLLKNLVIDIERAAKDELSAQR